MKGALERAFGHQGDAMESRLRQLVGLTVLVGVTYAAIGITFAWPATHVRVWRWAAWLVSGAVFAGHIALEQFGLRSTPRPAATRAALAVALGACGLAFGALVHSLLVGSSSDHLRLILIALIAWPVITAVPAFLAATITASLLARWQRRRRAD